jgi:integrase
MCYNLHLNKNKSPFIGLLFIFNTNMNRRRKIMASGHIRKRELKGGKHSWQIIIERDIDPSTGERKRIYRTLKGCTKKHAEKEMYKILNEINNNVYVEANTKTFGQFLEDWLDVYIKPNKSPTTYAGYERHVRKYIIPALGNKKLQQLKVIDIQKFYNSLLEESPLSGKPMKPKTIQNIHMNIRAALSQAVKLDLIKKSPADNVILPKTRKYKAEIYDQDEVTILMEKVKDTDLEVPISLAVGLGLRRGELLALTYDDVDFENSKIMIKHNQVQVGKEILTKEPKTESSIREIELPKTLVSLLQKERRKYYEKKMKAGADFKDHNLIVCKEDGEPIKSNSFSQKFRRFLARHDLKKLRFHDLRHTNATLMLKYGINPKVAQQRLGHASISTTMDIYSHVITEVEKEAAAKLDDGIFSNVKASGI